jgi:hypothetical protein
MGIVNEGNKKGTLFSRPSMMIGVKPMFGTAINTLEGTTLVRVAVCTTSVCTNT